MYIIHEKMSAEAIQCYNFDNAEIKGVVAEFLKFLYFTFQWSIINWLRMKQVESYKDFIDLKAEEGLFSRVCSYRTGDNGWKEQIYTG